MYLALLFYLGIGLFGARSILQLTNNSSPLQKVTLGLLVTLFWLPGGILLWLVSLYGKGKE